MNPQLGTIDYTNSLVDKGKTLGLDLERFRQSNPTTPPENAADSKSQPTLTLPDIAPKGFDTSSTDGLVSYYNDYYKVQDQIAQDRRAERQAAEQQSQSAFSKLMDSVKSPFQVRQDSYAETGINPQEYFAEQKAAISELSTLNNAYNKEVQKKEEIVAAIRNNEGSSLGFQDRTVASIEREWAPRLNNMAANIKTKSAIFELNQGRFQEAQKYVNEAVDAATADSKFKFELFDTFYKMNESTIDRLDSEYKDALKEGRDAAEKAWTTSVGEKEEVGKLMMDNPNAGITLNDSPEEAYQKVARSGGSLSARKEARTASDELDTTAPSGLLQKAIDSGMSPEEAALDIAGYYETQGVQIDNKTVNSWIKIARGLSPTPKNEAVSTESQKKRMGSKIPSKGGRSAQAIFKSLFGR